MPAPVDATHWPDPLAKSFARRTLAETLAGAGFTRVGVAFYPPPNPALTDEAILYEGVHGREFARRMREGHATEVFTSPDGQAAAEIDTRYGSDQLWLATLFEDGSVLWTSNTPSQKPVVRHYRPDPNDLRELDPEARARLESALGCFRADALVGDAEAAMHTPHRLVGFDILVHPVLDVPAMLAAHTARVAETRGTPVPASMDVLLAATERAIRVQSARERFAVYSGGVASLLGVACLGALLWTLFDGWFFWIAGFTLGPLGLLLAGLGFFMWPVRIGIPLSTWIPWPPRSPANRDLARIRARATIPAPGSGP
ncbi:MAG: hypothetical protein R3F61_14015 [Myxococcota bacterium]